MDADQFQRDGAQFFKHIPENLRTLNRNFAARILNSLSSDSHLCKFISESFECKSLLLDLLYHNAANLKWPLNANHEARVLSGMLTVIAGKTVENLVNSIDRSFSLRNTDISFATVSCVHMCVKIRKELNAIIKLSTAQMTVHSENLLSDTVHNINVYFQELEQLLSGNEAKSILFFSGVIHSTLEV
ncbi:hypothetical protein RF11_08673 [Thelohanellus kitauei]|uniref:Uncharacterized protein n=1 Tax=Thelohanellus kitauei TaxID=669202 RepID=A0A0C2J347_THEKT|nr:hypothetical protein RF11_08673 [Thelohanellus kitauei]